MRRGVSYYDFRNLTSETTTLPTDSWFTISADGGASFGKEVHVAGPFDMLTAPYARGFHDRHTLASPPSRDSRGR